MLDIADYYCLLICLMVRSAMQFRHPCVMMVDIVSACLLLYKRYAKRILSEKYYFNLSQPALFNKHDTAKIRYMCVFEREVHEKCFVLLSEGRHIRLH